MQDKERVEKELMETKMELSQKSVLLTAAEVFLSPLDVAKAFCS